MSDYFFNLSNEPNKPFSSGSYSVRSIRHSYIFDAGGPQKVIPGAFYAHPGLPIRRRLDTEVVNQYLGLMLPAGTIVTVESIPSGDIYIGKDVNGTAFSITRDHLYGWDGTVLGFVRPASPSAVAYTATTYDVNDFTRVLWTAGTALTAGSTKMLEVKETPAAAIDVGIKRPVGILLRDLYFDPVGKYAAEELPFVKGEALYTSGQICIPYARGKSAYKMNGDGYNAVLGLYPFLVIGDVDRNTLQGSSVIPDTYGNYAIFNDSYTLSLSGNAEDVVFTLPFKVGNIVAFDNRIPRQMLEFVQTDPNYSVTGTSTSGIYGYLYDFVKRVLIGSGANATPTAADIKTVIQSGDFGLAIINVEIA